MLYDDDMSFIFTFFFSRYLFIFSSRPSPGSRGLDLGGGDCSDRPDQNVSDPDRLIVYYIFFAAAIFPPSVGGEIKPLSFHQSTHLVDFTLFRPATLLYSKAPL